MTVAEKILATLAAAGRPLTTAEIAKRMDRDKHHIAARLSKMMYPAQVEREYHLVVPLRRRLSYWMLPRDEKKKSKIDRAKEAARLALAGPNGRIVDQIERLIARRELVLWIHHSDGTSAVVTAASVAIKGDAVQIEADPKWRFGRIE